LVAGGFSDSSLKVWFPCKFCIPKTREEGHRFDWGLASYGRRLRSFWLLCQYPLAHLPLLSKTLVNWNTLGLQW
jgi:hypothetical protein